MAGKEIISAVMLTFGVSTSATAQQAVSSIPANIGELKTVNIAPQTLQNALLLFSQQTGTQTSADAAVMQGQFSPGVAGTMTPQAAVARLLAGTGLSYQFISPATVLIVRPDSDNVTTSDVVTVTAVAETATGPVNGYRATRSATGTKTDTALRDIPQSIQVVPRAVITDRQTTSLSEALQNVSGVQQSGTSGNRAETFMVRGFSSPSYAIDGVMLNPVGDRPETFLDLANVERIEVLKGPASALYGRGQPGGLINIVTRQPSYTFGGDASLQTGSFGFWRGEGTVNGPLNDAKTLSGRLSGALQTEDGFQDARSRSSRQFISTALRWEPTDATRFTFGLDYTNQTLPFDRGLIVGEDNQVSLPPERFLGEKWSEINAHKTRISLGAEHNVNDQLTLRGSLRYDDARVNDTGIDYRALEDDGRTLNRRYSDRVEDSRNIDAQLEAQLKLYTGTIDHTLLSGVQYSRSRMDFTAYRANIDPIDIYDPVYGAAMPTTRLNSDFVENIKMASVFLQDQIEFSPQWKALAGLRYDRVWQEMDQKIGDGEPDINDGALTTRLGLVYQPINPVSLYASYAESFAPQSGQTRDGLALAPEEGWQVESGVKIDLIPDRLSLTTAVFQITKTNVKASDPLDSDYAVTTGEQRVRGVEIDLTGEITPGWRVIASSAYLDARITHDQDYEAGNRLTGVPLWSGSLWTTYELQRGALSGLKFGSGLQAVGARKGDLDNSFSVAGYYRLDAMVSYKLNKNLEFSLVGRNLTDQAYIATPVSRTENHPGAPRSVFATVKATF
ncbi:TonB-dependent siderophore receptor [Brenneria izbisi]|nr:TonB-dependent siderophore receptor [Brenneria izbisi]MCV9880791.1 TonB-dependent siderophore receptor [Brenneria izbisi]